MIWKFGETRVALITINYFSCNICFQSNDKKAREIVMTVCTAHQVDKESLLHLLLKASKVIILIHIIFLIQ